MTAPAARRGRLKIFFGACAGVGKTTAMLQAARALKQQGGEPLLGVVHTHGHAGTEALLEGLVPLPRRQIEHRGRGVGEFDLDAALALKPSLVLVDELAHTNVHGARHAKRWQDVQELLEAGIDVWTTLNVQHLESLNDVVRGIAGVRVWETVPDRLFDAADEVVLVDLPPDELLQRLEQGQVHLGAQAALTAGHFFRKGPLIALRELALRRTADRVDSQMLRYRQHVNAATVWPTRESLLACIGPDERCETVLRSTARLAAQLGVPWHCVYVETPGLQRLPDRVRHRILQLLQQAQALGAATATLSGQRLADTLVRYAREHNLSRLVIGRDPARRRGLWRGSLADAVGALGRDLDVVLVALPPRDAGARDGAASVDEAPRRRAWRPYVEALLPCALVALVTAPLHDTLELSNIVMLFLLAVVIAAVRLGRGPAVLAAFASVAAFDFFYVPPRYALAVGDAQYLLTFGVMLIVALLIGQMTAGLKFQVEVATQREQRMAALYEMSRDLSVALAVEDVARVGERFLATQFEAKGALLVTDLAGRLQRVAGEAAPRGAGDLEVDLAVAQWAHEHQAPAGLGTDTLAAAPLLYLPLKATMRWRGVLAIRPADASRLLGPEQRRLLDTGASLLAMALERVHYVEVAQASTVQVETERLRNSLLAAISHDLRTPLATLVGMAESLASASGTPQLRSAMASAIREAALRMNSQVDKLLDMARLESGELKLQRSWQSLEEVAGSALRALGPVLQGRPVQVDLPRDLPLVQVDASLLERVLCNLLENAAKHTPAGSAVEVSARVEGDELALRVADHGPGLPPGREQAIFEKFERGRREGATPGVGLGLAICRAIVQAHGGRIEGRTREGGGAEFLVRLPLGTPPVVEAEADGGAAERRELPAAAAQLEPPAVILERSEGSSGEADPSLRSG